MTAEPTIRKVLDTLRAERLLSDAGAAKMALLAVESAPLATPWYVRALLGASAWLAALFVLVFIGITLRINSAQTIFLLGVVLIATATAGRRFFEHIFLNQLLLAASFAGQAMVIGGIAKDGNDTGAALATIVMEIVLLILYRDATHRFISTLIAVVAAVVVCSELHMPNLILLLIILVAVGAFLIWENEIELVTSGKGDLFRPAGYALVVALLILPLLSITSGVWHELGINFMTHQTSWWLSSAGLLALAVALEFRILRSCGVPADSPSALTLFAATFLLALFLLGAPGITAALLVLLLGFHRGNRVLMGLALLFLPLFLVFFYYNLQQTLLLKSLTLMTSGVTLLIVRFIFRRLGGLSREVHHA